MPDHPSGPGRWRGRATLATAVAVVAAFLPMWQNAASAATTADDPDLYPAAATADAVPSGFVESSSVEDVAARTEYSRTWLNPDGTRTTKIGAEPINYLSAAGWQPIDNTLTVDAAGVVRTVANRWSASFAPLPGGGLSIIDGDLRLAMAPLGASPSLPLVGSDRSSVSYEEAWPGVDLRYRVTASAVKEDIVLTRRPATNVFSFATGTPLAATGDGGLRQVGGSGSWRVPPPEVLDRKGRPIAADVVRFVPAADGSAKVDVVVDQAWLDTLTDADFPVTIDPTTYIGNNYSAAFRSTVSSCGPPCSLRVGNPDTSWNTWRGLINFPWSNLHGRSVSHAQVEIWGLSAGTLANHPMALVQSTADNWWDFGATLVSNSYGTGGYTLASGTFTSYMNFWLQNSQQWKFKFIGDESSPNVMSYKQFDSFQLRIDWSYIAPSLTTDPWPTPSTQYEDGTVTISQPWTHPYAAEQARLFVCKAPGATPSGCTSGTWGSSGYGNPGTAQASFVPGHSIGGRSYWTYMCSVGACSGAGSGSFTVLNRAPSAGTITADKTTVQEGQRITWSVPFTDTNTGVSRAVICKTPSPNGGSCDSGQAWAANSGYVGSPARSYFDVPANYQAGTYTWYGYACDQDSACSTPVQQGSFTVQDLAAPGTITDSPDPVFVGNSITFSYGWSSSEGQKLVVCKTDAITQGTAACPGGQWAAGSVSSTSPSTAQSAAMTTAELGSRNYYGFLCTAANACATPGGPGTFLVQDPPAVVSASDSPDPVDPGSPVTFTVHWNSSVETVKAVVCKTNTITQGSATCPGGQWASGIAGASNPATAGFTPTTADSGVQSYYAFACTAGGACSPAPTPAAASGTFRVTSVPADSVMADPASQAKLVGEQAVVTVTAKNAAGGPAPGAPITISRSGANPQSAQTFNANASGIYTYTYTGQNPGLDEITVTNGTGGEPATATVAWGPAAPFAYPSDVCSAGGNILSGHLANLYLRYRQDANPLNPDERRVCIAAQAGDIHLGGLFAVSAGEGSVSPDVGVDTDQAAAESCRPIGYRADDGLVAGMDYYVDVARNPNGDNGAWICARIGDTYRRFRFAASAPTSVNFLPDLAAPKPYPELPLTGLYSGSCQANGGTRLVNVMVGADQPVALYTWNESPTKTYVCGRSGPAGGRLDVDSTAVPTIDASRTTRDASASPFPMFDNGTVSLWTVNPSNPMLPAGVFVGALDGTIGRQVTVTSGSGSVVAFNQDAS